MTTMKTKASKSRRTLFSVLFIGMLLCSTGCGNRVEINDRSIVLGVAIDRPQFPDEKKEEDSPQNESQAAEAQDSQKAKEQDTGDYRQNAPPPNRMPRYAMTIETPIISQLGSGSSGGSGGSQGGERKSWVLTSTGDTIFDIERSLAIREGRQDFYGHLKIIIISEEVAREGIEPVIDFFSRRREVQQNIQLAIANGEAREVLSVVPIADDFASFYIDSMLEALYRSAAKINTDLVAVRRSLAESGNVVLPRIRASSPSEVIAGGAAVIKNGRFIGWLSELETSGYNIVQNNVLGGSITIVDPQSKSTEGEPGLIALTIKKVNAQKSVRMVNKTPVYTIEIDSEWDVVEKGDGSSLWDIKYLHQIEERVAKEVQRRGLQVVDKMQREFKADVFGFGEMLNRKYPDHWDTVKGKWDEKYFPEAKIHIDVSAKIRRTDSKI